MLDEDSQKKSRRGGRRAGAGRKRSKANRHDPRHRTREPLDFRHPVHVMLSTLEDVPRLRQRRTYHAIRAVLFYFIANPDMRVVHISIQQSHLHLIVEATDKAALARGMKSFAIRTARAVNAAAKRKGKVFKFRYHAKQIRTEKYARNAIAYVLNNFRRHGEPIAVNCVLDPYSSAVSFTGWKNNRKWKLPFDYEPLPVSPPRTPLLKSNWMLFGLIDPWEVPGPPNLV